MTEKDILDNEEEILRKLIPLKDEVPKKTIHIKRLDIDVVLRALTGDEIFKIRDRCTIRNPKTGVEQFDNGKFNALLVATAIEKPNLKNKKLLDAYNVVSPEELVKKLFLAGELIQLVDIILDLSGYSEEIEEIKNS